MRGSGGGIGYIHAVEVLLDRICTDTMYFLLERGAGFDWT